MTTPTGTGEPRRDPPVWPYPPQPPTTQTTPSPAGHGHEQDTDSGAHGGHGLMMIACCLPMLAIAGILVLTGVAGPGLIVAALLCTAMMAVMMFAMPGGHGGHGQL